MSDTTTTTRRQASARQIAANRANSLKSTGAKTEAGRAASAMNNCSHGLYSTKELLPGEDPVERQQLVDDITTSAKPADGMQRLLTERIIETAWRVKRGERAQDARATKNINALVEGAATAEARRADALGATLDENVNSYHELLTFPAGLTYVLNEWSIILESLTKDLPLLASTRRRCFSLLGKTREQVLRSDRTATPLFLNLAGLMYGQEATVENILALLGTEPPEWMQDAEFEERAERLRGEVPTKTKALEALKGQVATIMADLNTKLVRAQEVAARDLELDATAACADVTPAGTKLANAIDKLDRSCLAAMRRLEARQRPQRPGPKTDPQTPATSAEDVDNLVEPDQSEPADVAADYKDAFAAEVPTDDQPELVAAATTEADEPEGVSEADVVAPDDAAPQMCQVEANSESHPAEATPEKCEVEAYSESDPADAAPKKCGVEANCVYGIKAPDFERFGPEADRMRRLYHHLEATGGTGGHAPDSERTPTDSRMARAMEEHAIRLAELSRQIDARFGINGERPDSS